MKFKSKTSFLIVAGLFAALFAFAPQPARASCSCASIPAIVEQITNVGGSLNYVSETDAEVVAVYRNASVSEVSISEFKRVFRLNPKQTVYQESAKDFFARVQITDPDGNWFALQDIFESLEAVTVFKVPRARPFQSNYDYFVVGRFAAGGGQLVGIQTFSIET